MIYLSMKSKCELNSILTGMHTIGAGQKRASTQPFDVVATIKNDTFSGRNSVTLMLEDMAF